jgi:hypothetical protein
MITAEDGDKINYFDRNTIKCDAYGEKLNTGGTECV